MRKRCLLAVVASGATAVAGLGAVPGASALAATAATATAVPHGGVLRVIMPWDKIPDNFNPLLPGGTSSTAGGTGSLLYEPLMYANAATGRYTPMLGTAYSWSDGNKILTLTTRTGVHWSDGKAFSASDVAFTFNYLKAHNVVDASGIWQDGLLAVRATGPSTVVFTFSRPNVIALPFVLSQLIVPEHIWAKVATAVTFANHKPVGTGPFLLKTYSPTEVSYTRNPDYWMAGRPYLSGVTMTASKIPDTVLFLNSDYAVTYQPLADPGSTFLAEDPADNHIWWPTTNLNFLYFNTTQAPFNDAAFRRAVAEALNNSAIALRAYYGAVPAAAGPTETGVTNGQASQWVPASLRSLEWSYDPAKAAATLGSAGYLEADGSLLGQQGQPLPVFKILIGAGWADYFSIAETVSQELAALGIHTVIDQEPYAGYEKDISSGAYNLAIGWGNGNNINPFYEYYYLLDGKTNTDWERYKSAKDSSALSSFETHASPLVQHADISTIERDILTNVPVVALTGRPNFLDYQTRSFTGFPSAANPYNAGEPPDAFNGGAEQLFLNVHLK